MIAVPPLSGCPLAKPAKTNWRWPSAGKNLTIGTTVGIIMDHWVVSPCCINPPAPMAHHRNDTNTPIRTTNSYHHPLKPPRPSGVTVVGRTTATATHTHNLAGPLCPSGSQHHWHLAVYQARHRDCVDMPDAGLHPHREAKHKQHTHTARVIVLCALLRPTCP